VFQNNELTDLPDDTLVLRFRATRDNGCFTLLYQRHLREVFLRISRVLREHRVQATDLTQDTFLKAYSNIDSYNGGISGRGCCASRGTSVSTTCNRRVSAGR
jgi:hypothetical protein